MRKKILFLITIISTLICGLSVHAESYTFREAELLDNIYMSKYQYSTNTIYYQQARFFRDPYGNYTYCIEPFIFFQAGSQYQTTSTPRNLTQAQIDRIKKIVYFGFGYKNHRDASWYAVTQLMIWQTSAPTEGDYYFTQTLNGARTNFFDSYITEINELINQFDREIPIANQTVTIIEGMSKEFTFGDYLGLYTTNNPEIKIEGNKIKIADLKEGEYDITLDRTIENYYGQPQVMYESPNSQDMIKRGNLDPKQVHFKIKVISNHIDIEKVDEDTKEPTPQGDASLDGAIYELYNDKDVLMNTVEIKDSKASIQNIAYGNYYLKEKQPGTGYTKNDKVYEINITAENPNSSIQVTNKVIEKKIIIEKKYGEKGNLVPEANIDFEVYDKNDNRLEIVTTNEEGKIELTLPYGEYKLVQLNTTDGYQKLNPITLKIIDTEEETLELEDYKIPVPNTKVKESIIIWILRLLLCLC